MSARVVLSRASQDLLREKFPPPSASWRAIIHHVTVCLGPPSAKEWAQIKMKSGSKVTLKATGYGHSKNAVAVRVSGVYSRNKTPHVTMYLGPGAKRKDSNSITEWKDVDPFPFKGVFEVFYPTSQKKK
eukprot:Lithocolla_globosa_v1_NODE_1843_length_2300_cov_12.534076.p2 type:complete len:129 gc:universal NODE_1843_length_2300_cov_12.534076:1744-2130(+)